MREHGIKDALIVRAMVDARGRRLVVMGVWGLLMIMLAVGS